jgi:hypothetical protein
MNRRPCAVLPTPLALSLALAMSVGASACGADRFIVIGTAQAPSTSGFIEVEDDGNPAEIKVHLEHLHPVDRLDATKNAYVAWLDSGEGAPRYAGVLRYDANTRVGELVTESPFRKFIVKVTAEANDKPASPGDLVVATQEVALDD